MYFSIIQTPNIIVAPIMCLALNGLGSRAELIEREGGIGYRFAL